MYKLPYRCCGNSNGRPIMHPSKTLILRTLKFGKLGEKQSEPTTGHITQTMTGVDHDWAYSRIMTTIALALVCNLEFWIWLIQWVFFMFFYSYTFRPTPNLIMSRGVYPPLSPWSKIPPCRCPSPSFSPPISISPRLSFPSALPLEVWTL